MYSHLITALKLNSQHMLSYKINFQTVVWSVQNCNEHDVSPNNKDGSKIK